MSPSARRRRSRSRASSREHWRPLAVIAFALGVHVLLFSVISAPDDPVKLGLGAPGAGVDGDAAYAATDSFEGVGGTFVYSEDCMQDAIAGAFVRVASCYFPFVDDRNACFGEAFAWYRVEAVGCASPDPDTIAELDATPLVDGDALDIDMLDLDVEQMLDKIVDDKIEDRLQGQVVDIPQPAVEVRPDDYDYLAEYDSKVEKQMVKHGKPGGAMEPPPPPPTPEPMPATAPTPPTPPGGGALSMRAPGAPGTPEQTAPSESTNPLGFDKVSLNGLGSLRITEPRDPLGPIGAGGSDGAGAGASTTPTAPLDHNRSREAIEKATGGTNDHVPDVEEGELTALNTRKWKYSSFFNRVKRQVADNWHPEQAYRLRDPNGNIYGTKDRMTVLTVSLTADGSLKKVVITGPSGVDFLDEEAIKAFEAAEPFPNPPSGLIDDDKMITFRFGFAFEINSRTPWKVFRYQ